MPGQAYKKYYEANREAICAKMRERNAERRRAQRAEAFQTPAGVEAWKEDNRERYYRCVESKITKKVNGWLNDPDICDAFKQFLRQCLWAHKGNLTPAFIRTLGALSIANAFRENVRVPEQVIDVADWVREGGDGETEAEAEAEAEGSEAEGDY